MSTFEPGWLPDPAGRHEYRWWDGTSWTEVVADGGVERTDPLAAHQPGPSTSAMQSAPAAGALPLRPGAAPFGPGRGPSHRSTYGLAAGVGVVIVGMLAAAVIVLRDNGGGGDEPADRPEPRQALTGIADMPEGWTEMQENFAPGENQICEPRPEAPEPPRQIEAGFERSQPSGALGHRIVETTSAFADEYLESATRQADSCGTWSEDYQSGGDTYTFTATSELANGPTFGDETVWYVVHVEYESPATTTHDVLVCLDRHDGVMSVFTLSTAPPTTDGDRSMVEELARRASDRLEGAV